MEKYRPSSDNYGKIAYQEEPGFGRKNAKLERMFANATWLQNCKQINSGMPLINR